MFEITHKLQLLQPCISHLTIMQFIKFLATAIKYYPSRRGRIQEDLLIRCRNNSFENIGSTRYIAYWVSYYWMIADQWASRVIYKNATSVRRDICFFSVCPTYNENLSLWIKMIFIITYPSYAVDYMAVFKNYHHA